jgi:hypothetical protein
MEQNTILPLYLSRNYEPTIIPELMLPIKCWFFEIGVADER